MRLMAEWEPQEAIWLSWPTGMHWSKESGDLIDHVWMKIVRVISESQKVFINAPQKNHPRITMLLSSSNLENITLYNHPNNDVWCRDHGAIFVEENGKVIATDWQFNGWGKRFGPYDLDDSIASKMGKSQGLKTIKYSEILEGGAIETNGKGVLITTEAVLLNPNRNPHLNRNQVERLLRERFGIQKTIWLGHGIEGDDTGGHIDDIARFVSEETVVISSDENGINHNTLEENYRRLRHGNLEIIKIPMPEVCKAKGWRLPVLPASYVNFLITNENVLVPTFRQPKNDDTALGTLQELFPKKKVIGIDSLDIVREGGALHCISMQQPKIHGKFNLYTI